MKLAEVAAAVASATPDFVVYKVSSPKCDEVYYGYSKGEDIETAFLTGAKREAEPDRGDVRMIMAAGGKENLRYELLDVFGNEEEAFAERNDLRAADSRSITGPSNFPASLYQRIQKSDPQRAAAWRISKNIHMMSAREAMGQPGAKYTYADVKALAADPAVKRQVVDDLDRMLYPDFVAKYFTQ